MVFQEMSCRPDIFSAVNRDLSGDGNTFRVTLVARDAEGAEFRETFRLTAFAEGTNTGSPCGSLRMPIQVKPHWSSM